MKLRALAVVGDLRQGDPETEVLQVIHDSRRVKRGALFVAIPGFHADGHDFIPDAVQRGAVAVCAERDVALPPHVALLRVQSGRRALAPLAGTFYGWPSRRLQVVGVTGTNGKTTVTHLIRAVLGQAGRKAGLIGTLGSRIGDRLLPVEHTTPEAVDLMDLLAQMAAARCDVVVMEVSSHALALSRVDGVEFDTAVFTNLSQDHLDFHGSMDAYLAAKARLYEGLGQGAGGEPPAKHGPKTAVINLDDAAAGALIARCQVPVLTYGIRSAADLVARETHVSPGGLRYRLCTRAGEAEIAMKLTGIFNVYNSLAAAAACIAQGVSLEAVQAGLQGACTVPGRLERVEAGQAFGVYVDYAHTPDGLEKALAAVRGLTDGRVIAVFGAGGDRDRGKRPRMGEVAGRLADYTIITSDNPRSENPEAILHDIEAGILPQGAPYQLIVDRSEAIRRAVEEAAAGDAVLIAGKGHETYQIFADRAIAFDDREVARHHIEARLARKGESL